MELDEIQKIWSMQDNQPLYVINEEALHRHIISKKRKAIYIANVSEWILIVANIASAGFLMLVNQVKLDQVFIILLAAWQFATAGYVLIHRLHRLNRQQRFDRNLLGDLQHAIATLSYQVRLSYIMRWNIFAICLMVVLSSWQNDKPVWMLITISLFFVLTFWASGWEHGIYKAKKRELEILQDKLQKEVNPRP